jgi:hypothetical protein
MYPWNSDAVILKNRNDMIVMNEEFQLSSVNELVDKTELSLNESTIFHLLNETQRGRKYNEFVVDSNGTANVAVQDFFSSRLLSSSSRKSCNLKKT